MLNYEVPYRYEQDALKLWKGVKQNTRISQKRGDPGKTLQATAEEAPPATTSNRRS